LRVIYQYLLAINSGRFFLLILLSYVALSFLFALIYYIIGAQNLIGIRGETPLGTFMDCFYFSTQTFTTVGYGAIAPKGIMASTMASFEAFIGLIFFAISTGLMYARFSRPRALLRYSKNALISPYADGKALMFRFANARNNVLMEASARVIMTLRNSPEDMVNRKYFNVKLEIDHVTFLPLTWTLVHKINDDSPLNGYTIEELEELDFEVMILISAFDDTFNQTVHSRRSYKAHELIKDARFVKAFSTNEHGEVELHLGDIDRYEPVS
jgi:inward rectifier potassium channel